MSLHRIFVCDGVRPDNEVVQEALDWVAEDKENRSATIQGKGNKTKLMKKDKKKKMSKCKHRDVYLEPPCYRPPFDEAMRIDERVRMLMDFMRSEDIEMANKELKAIRDILDKVEKVLND